MIVLLAEILGSQNNAMIFITTRQKPKFYFREIARLVWKNKIDE